MRWMWLAVGLASSWLGLVGAAHADQVVLTGGETLEGVVTERGDEVEVRMDVGTITFSRAEVQEIRRTPNLLSTLAEKRAKLAAGDVEGLYKLALWAEQNGLGSTAHGMFEEVVEKKPEHDGARRALGFRKLDGRWVDEASYMASKGYVLLDGQFVTKEVAEARAKADAEAAEVRRKELDERRLQSMEARLAEATRRVERAEADALEAKRRADAAAEREPSNVPLVVPYGYGVYGPPYGSIRSYGVQPGLRVNVSLGASAPATIGPAPASSPRPARKTSARR
ncbi:MAG: hypothetical protein HYV07_15135 [Deltaproteobacteria bacterium]|nr:hypothetical protein [Deltaproteobacteria bacterium]